MGNSMDVDFVAINITSGDPESLMSFYRDVVGLAGWPGMEFALAAGAAMLTFDNHSEIQGSAKEPPRWLLNLGITSLAAETERLKAAGVVCIRDQGIEDWGGKISTFVDLDGNYFQLMMGPGAVAADSG
jgi:predicted enzyme related to lactoylglutathione lyase